MILILSGPSGSGKSTVCAAMFERLSRSGTAVGGVYCAAVFENGVKVGIDAVMLGADQAGMPLARLRKGLDPVRARGGSAAGTSKHRVPMFDYGNPSDFAFGMWDFHGAAFGRVDSWVAAFLDRTSPATIATDKSGRNPVAIIDEIGPLELEHGLGFMRTLSSLDAIATDNGESCPVCIVTSRPEIAIALNERWPGSTVMEALPDGGFDIEAMLRMIRAGGRFSGPRRAGHPCRTPGAG